MIYGLPCRHLLLQRLKNDQNPLLSADDVPRRWHRGTCYGVIPQTKSTLTREKFSSIPASSDWGYSSCIHKFEQ